MIRHNWKYKLLALMVSLILWFYVYSERNPQSTRTFDVPLQTVGVARSYIAVPETSQVSVTVAGLKTNVDALSKEGVEALVNLSNLHPRSDITNVSLPVEKRLPNAVENGLSLTVTPAKVGVRLEALREKRLPVEVAFTSDPPPGYSYGTPLLTPSVVVVRGTASALAKVQHVLATIEGDAAGAATEDYYEVGAVDGAGSSVPGVAVRPGKVKAKLEMVEVPATKTVIVSPVFSGVPKFPARVSKYTVSPSFVTLQGKPSKLAGISVVPTDKIDIDGADATISHEADLRIPSGVRVSGARSVRVTVYITPD